MAYLSKQSVLNAFSLIKHSTPVADIGNFSSLQYFIATDRFTHCNDGASCDTNNKNNKALFISYVNDVVGLDDGAYLKSLKELFTGPKSLSASISSNFFSGSSVLDSSKTPDVEFPYPSREGQSLLYAINKELHVSEKLYPNLDKYLNQKEKIALSYWLLRKEGDIKDSSINGLRDALGVYYSPLFVNTLLPVNIENWNEMIKDLPILLVDDKATINKTDLFEEKEDNNEDELSRQIIYYGAPGTGKSKSIKRQVDDKGKKFFRTTFHPDSDYSTFVGAYKPKMDGGKIIYKFEPQAFTNAYVEAWNKKNDVYLIIEEINRGNCAQIFGDLFQLLDRKNGESEYPIKADSALADFLKEKLQKSERKDIPQIVKEGEELKLPKNLFIWATMNTSDQSLFPIDSAFKRRWDWKYVKIAKGRDKETKEELNWKVSFDFVEENKKYHCYFDWWDFIQTINNIIASATSSDDKKLGYFFCKPKEEGTEIDAETFVGKVVFYLWNDVLKEERPELFKVYSAIGEPSFDAFYKENEEGDTIVDVLALKDFVGNIFGEYFKEKVVIEEIIENEDLVLTSE